MPCVLLACSWFPQRPLCFDGSFASGLSVAGVAAIVGEFCAFLRPAAREWSIPCRGRAALSDPDGRRSRQRRAQRRNWRVARTLGANHALVGDLDDRVLTRRADVLAGLDTVLGEARALGGTDALDGGLVVEGPEIARDRLGVRLLGKEAHAQGMHRLALLQTCYGIEPVLAENVEIRQRVWIEDFLRARQLDDEPTK